ncbi:MAG: PqqD family protein, partial [Bythopirellula sp.]
MATLADSIVSSSSRRLAIRVRPDLKARKQRYQGRVYWVVKDPVGLQYYRFEEEEFAILQMLDGQSSLEEIAEQFEAEFPPQTIRVEELQNFIGMLHRSGLVLSDAPGQGVQLKKRRDERRRKEVIGSMSNILA